MIPSYSAILFFFYGDSFFLSSEEFDQHGFSFYGFFWHKEIGLIQAGRELVISESYRPTSDSGQKSCIEGQFESENRNT